MDDSTKVAVVTGASSGIGAELAHLLATRGYRLVAVARREERLAELCLRITATGGVCAAFPADLSQRSERERLITALAPNASHIEVLVNNAGFGTHGYFTDTDLDRELEMIDVNCAAPVHLTKRLLPAMRARGRAYVLNVASVAAFQPGPLMAVYYASKAFVLSFSEALSEECAGSAITVSALCPGTIATEFQANAGIAPSARPAYATRMTAREAAELGLEGMFAGKRVIVTGGRQKTAIFLNRFLSRRLITKAVKKIQQQRLGRSSELGARRSTR